MIYTLSVIAVFGIMVFLSGAAFGAFILIVVSMHKTSCAPLSDTHGERRRGAISRRVLVEARTGSREIEE